jgi:phage terminase large subunit
MKFKADISVNGYIYNRLATAPTTVVINYGGAGSGKSYTQAQYEVLKTFGKGHKILVIRKVAATLIDSCIPLVTKEIIAEKLKASQLFQFNKSERILTNIVSKSQMLFRGLDDPEKIKSIAGITRIWIEEASELNEVDYDQLLIRLRQPDKPLQLTLTFNPIDENHWIKKRFFDNPAENKKVTIIKSTYKDNPFLTGEYIERLRAFQNIDYNFFKVYALGEWGKMDSGAEFYKQFKPALHVGNTFYNPALPLHLSFDENVNPYLTCTIWQAQDKNVWQVDEICLASPSNTLNYTLTEFKKRFMHHCGGVYIYGDATSKKADTKLEKGYNFFTLIRNGLTDFRPILRIPDSNPAVMMRGLFVNAIFQERFAGISITISDKCKNTIEDLKYVKEASDGTKLKEKTRDPKTNVSYERYGHCSDSLDYFICRYFDNEYRLFQRGGETSKRVALKTHSPIQY